MDYPDDLSEYLEPTGDNDALLDEAVIRFRRLAKFYEIEWRDNQTNWRKLAIKLALAHVPGLQVKKKRGRKATRNTDAARGDRRKLLDLVNAKKIGRSGHLSGDRAILGQLMREKPSRIPTSMAGKKLETLRSELGTARKERREDQQFQQWQAALAKALDA